MVYKSSWINVWKHKKNSGSPRATADQPPDKIYYPGEDILRLCRPVSEKLSSVSCATGIEEIKAKSA